MWAFAGCQVLLKLRRSDVQRHNQPAVALLLESASNRARALFKRGGIDNVGIALGVVLPDVELGETFRLQQTKPSLDAPAQVLVLLAGGRPPQLGRSVRIVRFCKTVVLDRLE